MSPHCSEHCHNQVEPDSHLSQMVHAIVLSALDVSAARDWDTC